MSDPATPITVAYGDGIGPEIMEACLHIVQEAGANLCVESIEVGERIYKQGAKDGMLPSALPLLHRTGILLMGPIIIPKHDKCESLHLSLSHEFGLKYSRAFSASNIAHAPKHHGYQTVGETFALFSSTQDATPKLAGHNTGNPSALLQAAMMLLMHIDQEAIAQRIHTAWQHTLADGIHTKDVYGKHSAEKVGTQEFAEAVVARLR